MRQRLSSRLTLFWKVFPIVWLTLSSIWIINALAHLTDPEHLQWVSNSKLVLAILLVFSLSWFFFWICWNLKTVLLVDEELVISDFVKVAEIPISLIKDVSGPDGFSLRRIAIELRQPSIFGTRIIFAPSFLYANETAELLKRKIDPRTS